MEQLKITRRNRKGNLTRVLKELSCLIDRQANQADIDKVKAKARSRFESIEEAHDELVELIESDEDYDKEQEWMTRCQDEFMAEMAKLEEMSRQKTEPTQESSEKQDVTIDDDKGQINENNVNDSVNTEASSASNIVVDNPNVDSNLIGLFKALSLPQSQVKQYDGNPLYYHAFMASFNNTISCIHDDNIRLNTLMSLCSGKALESIQYCVLKPPSEGYQSACKTLKERFGNTAVIVQSWINKVLNRTKIEVSKLGEFSDDLENCFESLSALGYVHELNNQSSLKQIIEKLPKFLQNKWQGENYKLKNQGTIPGLENVVKFVRASAMQINDPIFGNVDSQSAVPFKPKRSHQVHNVKLPSIPLQDRPQERFQKCWICKSNDHWPDQCKKFLDMKVEDRYELTKDNHACFSCLKIAGRNHRLSNCTRKRVCGESIGDVPCDRFHHKLLHLKKNVGNVSHLSLKCSDEPLLCVLQVEVITKEGNQMANVMLDSGSQGTFVREDFVDRLKIKGKCVAASITKIGGTEENFQSKICDLKLN